MTTLKHLPALLFATAVCASAGAQNTYSLVASDFQFTPLVLNINTGDTVRVSLNPGHSFREVSQTSWDLNVGSPGIGWEFNESSELTVHDLVTTTPGTIYYVCVSHLDMGMKGRIVVVEGTIGMTENSRGTYRIQPNPTTGPVRLIGAPTTAVRARVLDATGRVCLDFRLPSDGPFGLGNLEPGQYTLVLLDGTGAAVGNELLVLQDR